MDRSLVVLQWAVGVCDVLLLAWIARSLVVLQWAVGVCDGPLLVRLVGKNVSELTAAELLCALWTRHGATLHDLTTPGDAQLNHNHHRAARRAGRGARKQQLHVSRDDNKTARQIADHDNDNASLTVAAIYTVYSFNNSVKN